jgi:hypothetical protein
LFRKGFKKLFSICRIAALTFIGIAHNLPTPEFYVI